MRYEVNSDGYGCYTVGQPYDTGWEPIKDFNNERDAQAYAEELNAPHLTARITRLESRIRQLEEYIRLIAAERGTEEER